MKLSPSAKNALRPKEAFLSLLKKISEMVQNRQKVKAKYLKCEVRYGKIVTGLYLCQQSFQMIQFVLILIFHFIDTIFDTSHT